MFTEAEKKWLERRKNLCARCEFNLYDNPCIKYGKRGASGEFYPGSDDPTLNGLDCKPRNSAEKTVADTLADRQQDYGDAKESFDRIASLWNIWLAGKSTITPHDVAMMMVLFKVAREKYKTKDDNLVDIGGYAELARRL